MDLVACWDVPLSDSMYRVEFEHGTTTGKRVIKVNGKEIHRQDWMFKLVGREMFTISKAKCTISIEAGPGFTYMYSLTVNGKSLKKFSENQSKVIRAWATSLGGVDYRIALEKDTMDVYVNGDRMETAGEFSDDGTDTHFAVGPFPACIRATSSGKRRGGIVHTLSVNDLEVPECNE